MIAYARLGDITTEQFRALADIQRDFALDIRITNRQNFALRDLTEADVRALYDRLERDRHGRAGRRARPRRRLVPGRRHLQPRGHAVARARGGDRRRARGRRPRRGAAACASTSPAARTAAASTTSPTSGSSGSSAARTDAPRPATRCCSAGTSATREVEFGDKATKVPAKTAPEAVVRIVGRFNEERQPGETFSALARPLGRRQGRRRHRSTDLDHFPTPDVGPEFYVDYDETGPYVAEVGDGECAAT